MTENHNHHGTEVPLTSAKHESMEPASIVEHGQSQTAPAHDHSEHGAMQHEEIENVSPMTHDGHSTAHTDHSGHEQMLRRKYLP